MARRTQATAPSAPRAKKKKPVKTPASHKRSQRVSPGSELETARKRIRDLEELHRTVGQRLDAAIATIHKILGRAA